MTQDIPAGFPDVIRILTAARKAGGAVYTLPTPGAALNWKQRAYRFRRLLQANAQKAAPPGVIATTIWDDMVLKHKRGETRIIIEFGVIQGDLVSLDGEPLSQNNRVMEQATDYVPVTVADTDDPLLAEALELVNERGDFDD